MLVIVLSLIYLTYQDKLGQGPCPLAQCHELTHPCIGYPGKWNHHRSRAFEHNWGMGGGAGGGGWHEVVLLSQEEGCYKNTPQGYAECPRQC